MIHTLLTFVAIAAVIGSGYASVKTLQKLD